jgi:hypothetical protein
MRRIRSVVAVPVLVSALAAGAAGATGATAAAGQPTGAALLAASLKAAKHQSSVHIDEVSSSAGQSITVTGSFAASTGSETLSFTVGKKSWTLRSLLVDSTVYFKTNTTGLEQYLGMPTSLAPRYSNRWIAFDSSDPDFSTIANSMTLSFVIGEITMTGKVTQGAQTTVDGTAVVSLRGSAGGSTAKSHHLVQTLYVPAGGTPLPVRLTETGVSTKKKESGSITFGDWGKKVSVAKPSGAVPESTIAAQVSASTTTTTG